MPISKCSEPASPGNGSNFRRGECPPESYHLLLHRTSLFINWEGCDCAGLLLKQKVNAGTALAQALMPLWSQQLWLMIISVFPEEEGEELAAGLAASEEKSKSS